MWGGFVEGGDCAVGGEAGEAPVAGGMGNWADWCRRCRSHQRACCHRGCWDVVEVGGRSGGGGWGEGGWRGRVLDGRVGVGVGEGGGGWGCCVGEGEWRGRRWRGG